MRSDKPLLIPRGENSAVVAAQGQNIQINREGKKKEKKEITRKVHSVDRVVVDSYFADRQYNLAATNIRFELLR